MADSSGPRKSLQSLKPYPEFPLTAHRTRRWCKKVRGKIHYFGPIDKPEEALRQWLEQRDDLMAGRTPRVRQPGGPTLRDLVGKFLDQKRRLVESRELTVWTLADYHRVCTSLVNRFGASKFLDDFSVDDFSDYRAALAKRLGKVALGNAVQRARSVFKYAYDSRMIAVPVFFGPGFKRPTKRTLRIEKSKRGPKLFDREELLKLLAKARPQMRAMILLGLNGGLGNSDLANLRISAVNLKSGWIDYPRPKTGIERQFPLWPETVAAIELVLAKRPKPRSAEAEDLVFLTHRGNPWVSVEFKKIEGVSHGEMAKWSGNFDPKITKEFRKLLVGAHVELRKGRSFYTLRHMFETIGGDSRDQVATNFIMGHADESMAAVYRETIFRDRLKDVVDHVRAWLFGYR
ncbi:MAG: site-specific integrase [Gemmataceae bacterium]|nr:site-specific integrase [Gemmataceae bacterium]